MLGNFTSFDFCDVSVDQMLVPKIRDVCLLGILVPLAGEDAGPSDLLEANSQPTNSCKQVDEAERVLPLFGCLLAHVSQDDSIVLQLLWVLPNRAERYFGFGFRSAASLGWAT